MNASSLSSFKPVSHQPVTHQSQHEDVDLSSLLANPRQPSPVMIMKITRESVQVSSFYTVTAEKFECAILHDSMRHS